ncbi:MAG: hypothetical protein ACI4Q4_05735 [Oscillospiraceae bacterium]
MKHTLRKYLSNRGSALFMVISTMTALLIAVMAMYFSVVSSRTVQYAVFNQEQAFQSAVSIQDAIVYGERAKIEPLLAKMDSLEIGETIGTNGNGFAAFGGTEIDQDNVGSYDITITRLADEGSKKVYDIATTVSVNGVAETTHTIIYPPEDDPPETENGIGSDDIFCSTGYVPNNSYLQAGYYYTKSVYDNEFTVIGISSAGFLMADLNCGGSIEFNYIQDTPATKGIRSVTWIIRDTMYHNCSQTLQLGLSASDRGKLYIGGDYYLKDGTWAPIKNTDIYILGDCYLGTGGINWSNSSLHVDGNIYYIGGSLPSELYVNGSVMKGTTAWIDGQSVVTGWTEQTGPFTKWADADADEAVEKIDNGTKSHDFQKWEPDDAKLSAAKTYISFNTTNGSGGADAINEKGEVVPNNTFTYELKWNGTSDTQYADIMRIHDYSDAPAANGNYTILIDTGDDPDNKYYLRLHGIRNWDGVNDNGEDGSGNETFSWYPTSKNNTTGKAGASIGTVNVIYKGNGSVICHVCDDVRYIATDQEVVMHLGFFEISGGTVTGTGPSARYSQQASCTYDYARFMQYIHPTCEEGDECSYDVANGICPECGSANITVSCDRHKVSKTRCTNEECMYYGELTKNEDTGRYYGLCSNRLDVTKLTADGRTIPNTNFYIVSCDESAEIYISDYFDKNLDTLVSVKDNRFFGFIYAPYMTFEGYGQSGSGVRFLGGMVVSDYILKDFYDYLTVYPDKMPWELGATAGTIRGASKDWKITVARH